MNKKLSGKSRKSKPYPRRCAECGKESVSQTTIAHDATVKHDGKIHEFCIPELPVDQCDDCGEVFFTTVSSDAKADALKEHLGLLHAKQIRKLLAEHKLTQRKFAQHIRVAEESVSRWLNNLSIQSRALDTLMRLYFSFPQVRESLASGKPIESAQGMSDGNVIVTHAITIANLSYEAGTEHPIFGDSFSKPTMQRRKNFQLIA